MNEKYRRVAQIHAGSIDQGFLSSLGIGFLSLLYQAIDETENSALIVAAEDGRIVAFVSGTTGIGSVYRTMMGHWGRLALALLPALVSPRKIARILEIVLYGRKAPAAVMPLPAAELLSISVDPAFRGKQHADRLYRELAGFFKSKSVPRFKIVAGEALTPAHRFYAKMGATAVGSIEVHRGEKSIVYIQEVI